MNMIQSFKMAFSAILGNKMRSFLTMLGIIIGVFAVVVLVSIVQGATNSVMSQLQGMGTNLLSVAVTGNRTALEYDDLDVLLDMEGISACAPNISGNVTLRGNGETLYKQLYGANDQYLKAMEYELLDGRDINQTDMDNRFQVAVIGVDIADDIFGYRDVVGETLRINGHSYKVVGILEEVADSMFSSPNELVIIPFQTAERLLQMRSIRSITILVQDSDRVPEMKSLVETEVERLVGEDNYSVSSSQELLNTMNDAFDTLTLMMGGVAGISLLVGGIGIMNIMLVSVTERTREIGIRKAIGAKRRAILSQFLIEAIVVTLIGGIIALGFSHIALIILGNFMGIALSMSAETIALGVGFCLVIGLVFGVYPANKASKLNPIEALRHE